MGRLLAYAWPGNVRELENIIERAVILANGTILEIDSNILSLASPTAVLNVQIFCYLVDRKVTQGILPLFGLGSRRRRGNESRR
jgi:DNA-binding NtrC family response regulator